MRAALEASKHSNLKVGIISKTSPLRSTTGCTGGGLNAVFNNSDDTDSFEKHAYDTITGGSFLGDQDAIDFFVKHSPDAITELAEFGAPFFLDSSGKISQRQGPGSSAPRTCWTLGHATAHALYDQLLYANVTELSMCNILELVVTDSAVHGVIAYDSLTGKLIPIAAKSIVIATGGYGRVYWSRTTTPLGCTGDGVAVCLNAGIPVKDPEFIQFHPSALVDSGVLISDAPRTEGAYLLNNRNERFMKNYAPEQMEKATRDLVAIAIEKEIEAGRGLGHELNSHVLLDLRHLDKNLLHGGRLSQTDYTAKTFALVDPLQSPLPIRPSCHFTMGGIDIVDYHTCATIIPGVFAAGECACLSIHGANRLGGNALPEVVVFGKVAGAAAALFALTAPQQYDFALDSALQKWQEKFKYISNKKSSIPLPEIRDRLAQTLWHNVGVIRDEQRLNKAIVEIDILQDRYTQTGIADTNHIGNTDFIHYAEIGNMLTIAKALTIGALNRRETRGSHFRSDYCNNDDTSFLKHTIITKEDNRYNISYRPVTMTKYLPVGVEKYV